MLLANGLLIHIFKAYNFQLTVRYNVIVFGGIDFI